MGGIDPNDYDVDELRELSGGEFPDAPFERRVRERGFLWATPSDRRRLGIEDPTPKQRRQLAALADLDADSLGEKPYLERLPDDDRTIRTWLDSLSADAGYEGTLDALERYRRLGWYTEAVESGLRDHMIAVERRDGDGIGALDQTDHLLSLAHVARLAAASDDR